MTLPSSGSLSFSQINTELGRSASASISLNDAAVRALAGKSSGTISFSDLRGKSSVTPPTISLSITGNNQTTNGGTVYAYINCSLGGNPTTSGARISGSSALSFSRMSNTQYRVGLAENYTNTRYSATYRITATNSAGSSYRDATVTLITTPDPYASCFTADTLVLMADGSQKRIDEIEVGEAVRTAVGVAEVWQIDKPLLGDRPLVSFDGKAKTSGEHSFWSRNPSTGLQWWATRDMEQWRHEALTGQGPNFAGHEPYDLTGQDNLLWEFATETGWQMTQSQRHLASPDTQLYHLLLTEGGSYFVDGYLVSSLADQESGVDWETFIWNPLT